MVLLALLTGCCGGFTLSDPDVSPAEAPSELDAAPTPDVVTGSAPGRFIDDRPFRHDDDISAVAFSADDATMVTAAGEKLFLWDLATRQQVAIKPNPCGQYNRIGSLQMSPDGAKMVMTCGYRESPRVMDNDSSDVATLPRDGDEVYWGSDDVIAVSDNDGVSLYDGSTLDELASFDTSYNSSIHHRDGIWLIDQVEAEPEAQLVAWSREGEKWRVESNGSTAILGPDQIVQASYRGATRRDLATGEERGPWPGDFGFSSDLASAPEGVWIDGPGGMTRRDASGEQLVFIPADVDDVVVSPGGQWIAHLAGRTLALYDAVGTLQADQGVWSSSSVQDLVVWVGGRYLVTVSDEEVVWSDREAQRSSRGQVEDPSSVAVRSDGVAFVGGGELLRVGADGSMKLLESEVGSIGALGFTPSGRHLWLITTGYSEPVVLAIFDADSGQQVFQQSLFESSSSEVVAFLDDNDDLIVAGNEGRIYVQPLPANLR